mmetsp:Transcript_1799/g.2799  ORF Transcript_1799/g.2799 Transcript_1799/m.2799 type:complete len:109 (-) Transcript_1799:21-347(-)
MHRLLLVLLIACVASSAVAHIYNERCIQCIEINVYFHAIAYNNSSLFFFNATQSFESLLPRIDANMKVLNHEFNETPFVFVWKNVDSLSTGNGTRQTIDMCVRYKKQI